MYFPLVSDSELQSAGYYVAFVLWIVSAIVSTCYTFTWDIKMDWGLFEGKYKLRSELIYQHKVRGQYSHLCSIDLLLTLRCHNLYHNS